MWCHNKAPGDNRKRNLGITIKISVTDLGGCHNYLSRPTLLNILLAHIPRRLLPTLVATFETKLDRWTTNTAQLVPYLSARLFD